jgi:hypothetical protein
MAANDNLGLGIVWVPPSTNSADLEWRPGTSTDPELFPVASFDAATSQKMDGHGRMSPKYTGAPLKVSAPWMAASATTGSFKLCASFRYRSPTADVDTAFTYVEQSVTVSAPGTAGFTGLAEIPFTAAQIDGLPAGGSFTLRLRRDVTVGSNMAGDAQVNLGEVMVLET